jgi:hypothetical protein
VTTSYRVQTSTMIQPQGGHVQASNKFNNQFHISYDIHSNITVSGEYYRLVGYHNLVFINRVHSMTGPIRECATMNRKCSHMQQYAETKNDQPSVSVDDPVSSPSTSGTID